MTDERTPTPDEREAAARHAAISEGWVDDADEVALEANDVTGDVYDACSYTAGAATFLVLTQDEADERAKQEIQQCAWAFNASFLVDYVPKGIEVEHIEKMRGNSCEDFNEPILALIEAGAGFEEFWTDAVAADGLGHFLAGYDHQQIELGDIDGHDWYAFRTN